MKIEEIKQNLIEKYGISEEIINNIKGKVKLLNLLNSLQRSSETNPNIMSNNDGFEFDNAIPEELNMFGDKHTPEINKEQMNRLHPKWTDYILSKLEKDEYDIDKANPDKKYPRCDGMRRILEVEVAKIISIESTIIQAPNPDNCMTATVRCTLRLENGEVYQATADGRKEDIAYPFNCHVSAISETRSQARAYRQALRLKNIVSQEEIAGQNNEQINPSNINSTQIGLIDVLCNNSRLNINVKKLFDYIFKDKKEEKIQNYSHEQAAQICKLLSEYQANINTIPSELLGYSPDWRL